MGMENEETNCSICGRFLIRGEDHRCPDETDAERIGKLEFSLQCCQDMLYGHEERFEALEKYLNISLDSKTEDPGSEFIYIKISKKSSD